MRRTLDLWMTASDFKLEIEDIIFTLTELIEDGTQHGFIDRENKQFHHITAEEHKRLISLLSKDKVLISAISQELEVPQKSIKEGLEMLVKSNQIQGIFSVDEAYFFPEQVITKDIKESFIKSGKLGITEAAKALQLDETLLRKVIRSLRSSNELEGQYSADNEYFYTSKRLEADILDFLKDEKRFPINQLALKLNLKHEVLIEILESLVQKKYVNGAITKNNEFISDEELDQALVEAVLPYSRMSIVELAEQFGFTEKNMKLLIARAISKGIVAGSIDSVSNEFVKAALTTPTKPAIPETHDLIDVKRDYDYLGGDIRFKIALQNITKTAVSKISVLLNVPDQFQIGRNVEKVDILNPGEARGVDFVFTPLACGKGQIFGTVSYTDAFGEPHSVTIRPKEVWVKCPLVKSQKASTTEADAWRLELQKSSSKIDAAGITRLEAFRVGCEQIAALDLAEVKRNEDIFTATFSGIAKVTGDRLLVEVSMDKEDLVLDIYTSDQKQATGFLAYMRNLIKISLDVSRKLKVKSEKLGIKVLTAFQIAQAIFNLCDYCEIRSAICDFILQLKEIAFKLHKEFPEVKFYSPLLHWQEELSQFDENVSIPESIANTLEYEAIVWLNEIESIAGNNAKIYLDSFDSTDETRTVKVMRGLEGIRNEIQRKESNYSIRVAHYLLVIYKLSGLCLFSYKFSPGEFDPDLMSGFLQAIQSFGTEFSSSEESGMRRLSYKDFEIVIEESEYVRAALVGIGKITDFLQDQLKDFVKLFSAQFRDDLTHFEGRVEQFRITEEIVKNIFGVPQARLDGSEK
jgi:hypothetical protein